MGEGVSWAALLAGRGIHFCWPRWRLSYNGEMMTGHLLPAMELDRKGFDPLTWHSPQAAL